MGNLIECCRTFQDMIENRNPKHSEGGSNILLVQWNGYGSVERTYVIPKLKSGKRVRADFDFCEVVNRGGQP